MGALGERPDDARLRKEWEQGVRKLAHYRLRYNITDPNDPLGKKPQSQEQQRDCRDRQESRLTAAGTLEWHPFDGLLVALVAWTRKDVRGLSWALVASRCLWL